MTDRTPDRHPSDLPGDRAEQVVAAAFAAFAEHRRDRATPPGVNAVFASAAHARRRKRGYASGLAAAAVLVLAAGLAGTLSFDEAPERHATADHSPAVTRTPETAAPTTISTPTPAAPSPRDRKPTPPRVQDVDLRNTTVRVDPLRDENTCSGGLLRFRAGQAGDSDGCAWRIAHGDVRYADIDGTAGDEVITMISAGLPNADYTDAVIAFRAAGPGRLKAMSYVYVAEHGSQGVRGISIGDDGRIVVEIEDSSWDPEQPRRQERSFRWAAGAVAFEQIGGPTAFPSPRQEPEPSDSTPSGSPSPSE